MLITLFSIILITLGGTCLTYIYEREDSLMMRLAAGNIIGAALFSLTAFLAACLLGMSAAVVLVSILVSLFPLALLLNGPIRTAACGDLHRARGQLNNTTGPKILNAAYYAGFLLLLYLFFDRAMIETPTGIFSGGSQNLGDLPFHLGAIYSFTDGQNFPPENPSYAFAKFTYPFMADLVTSCFVMLGAGVRAAMLIQNITLGLSLVLLFEKFSHALTGNRRAGKIATVIFLFSGGLGFVYFLHDYWRDGRGFLEFLWSMPFDYTIRPETWRWGNPLVVLFMTQRSLLIGMPLTLIVLTRLWNLFSTDPADRTGGQSLSTVFYNRFLPLLLMGLLTGTLPLVHSHSLAVLFIVTGVLFFLRLDLWREWIVFGLGVTVIAVPELVWVMTGSATRLSEFVDWHFGWDAQKQNYIVFWLRNLGLFMPLLLVALAMIFNRHRESERAKGNGPGLPPESESSRAGHLLLFYLPFVLIFIISNTLKLAPWEWDNIKVLIYWFVGSVPLVGWILAMLWDGGKFYKLVAAAALAVLSFSGALDVWRTVSRQTNMEIFGRDSVKLAEQIRQKTSPRAMFLNAPTYNSTVVLTGRRSLMRYTGHLASYGIDYESREQEVRRMYEGTALAEGLFKKYGIDYVIISPEETASFNDSHTEINEQFFSKYPLIAQVGAYRVYQITK
jgi:hypothetical protein